jgi:DNA polymerase-3 subunit alpha
MAAAIESREANGPFESLEDFATRLDTKTVNRKIMESLIKAGAFDFTLVWRDAMFSRLGQVLAASSAAQKDRASGQESLFDMTEVASSAPLPSIEGEETVKWSLEEMLHHEKICLVSTLPDIRSIPTARPSRLEVFNKSVISRT